MGPGKTSFRLLEDVKEHDVSIHHRHRFATSYEEEGRVEAICESCFTGVVLQAQGTSSELQHLHETEGGLVSCTSGLRVQTTYLPSSIPPSMLQYASVEHLSHTSLPTQDPPTIPPSPYTFFLTMAVLVRNVLQGVNRPVASHKPVVLSRIGHAEGFLQWLGFREDEEDSLPIWRPPVVPDDDTRRYFERVVVELSLRALAAATREEIDGRSINWKYEPEMAEGRMAELLGGVQPQGLIHVEPDPHYATLGVAYYDTPDFITRAYTLQCNDDPGNAPTYLESFEKIAGSNEELQIALATFKSQGAYTRRELADAYRLLNASPSAEEDTIVEALQLHSSSEVSQLREAIGIIGRARGSKRLSFLATSFALSLDEAYSLLHTPSGTSDQLLLNCYQIGVSDRPDEELQMRTALEKIAIARDSLVLFNFLEELGPATQMGVDAAYHMLGVVDRTFSDDEIMDLYPIRVGDQPDTVMSLRAALRAIGNERRSPRILHFLQTGQRTEPEPAQGSVSWPVGLENIGNTCYLNSLMQFYFCIRPLREMILAFEPFTPAQLEDAGGITRRIGGRKVTRKEISRAQKFVGALKTLFEALTHSPLQSITPDRELAYLALVSSKDEDESPTPSSPPLRPPPPSRPEKEEESDSTLIEHQEEGFVVVHKENVPPVLTPPDTPPPPPPVRRRSSILFGRQQDVTECIENCMFQIESAMIPRALDENGEQLDMIKDLFFGRTTQTLAQEASKESRSKVEMFSNLLVDVAGGPRSLYDALDDIFDASVLSVDGHQTRRFLTLSTLPPILQIQIQRVQFDRATLRTFKSNAYLDFPKTIYLDRYHTEDLSLREEAWRKKDELARLRHRRELLISDTPAAEVLRLARDYLVSVKEVVGVEQVVLDVLEDEQRLHVQEVEHIEGRITELQLTLEQTFSELQAHEYRIHSVFIHRGQANFGHYWIYIYDHEAGIWRKYNDGYVTEVGEAEIWEESTATPYMLVYISQQDLVQAVNRQPS